MARPIEDSDLLLPCVDLFAQDFERHLVAVGDDRRAVGAFDRADRVVQVEELLGRVPDVWVSVSVTTRAPRPEEVEGVSYEFITAEEFDRLVRPQDMTRPG